MTLHEIHYVINHKKRERVHIVSPNMHRHRRTCFVQETSFDATTNRVGCLDHKLSVSFSAVTGFSAITCMQEKGCTR